MRGLPTPDTFAELAAAAGPNTLVPMYRRLLSDALTPVLAYRRLVQGDDRMAPSFLLESVVGGDRIERYSFLGSRPAAELIARGHDVEYRDHADPANHRTYRSDDPLTDMQQQMAGVSLAAVDGLPDFTGGWVGFAGYDTVRYLEGESLPNPPADDRGLPDLHFQLYNDVIAFDHVQKTLLVITHVKPADHASPDAAYAAGLAQLDELTDRLTAPRAGSEQRHYEIQPGHVDLAAPPPTLPTSNMGEGGYQDAVRKCKAFIAAGDAFQIVPSQRFAIDTSADPFDVYRALRVVNPSPYMFYVQIEGAMLVGSSPEILCKVENGKVTSRPLAGTRKRGATTEEDAALEAELVADPKDRAEHIMLVDLHRNDVGRVAIPGTVELPEVLTVERYSHVMHISSQVTGTMREGVDCWDALRVSLPVGTVSGAPKVRAMQIIDDLETTRRGPYAGAVGYADFAGNMDMAIALRTMVVLPGSRDQGPGISQGSGPTGGSDTPDPRTLNPGPWIVHIQAGAGIVADSDPDAEHVETVNKAAALAKAVELAEHASG